MIHVVATITVRPGKREAFLTEFRELTPKVRAEDGCVEYGATIDIETTLPAQGPLRDNVVTVIEKWRDVDALAAHFIATHMLEYRKQVKDLVEGTSLQILAPA